MSHCRIIALDLDGTLLRHDGSIDPADVAAIHAARRAGVLVVIATGRLVNGAMHALRSLPVDGPLVCADGRLVACARTGAHLADLEFEPCSKARALALAAARAGVHREQVAAVGDWLNDISMLAWAGRSFAMAGAPPPVRAAAAESLTCRSGAGGGVAEAIERSLGRSSAPRVR
ncbi:MAG: HAD family phosphatase [Polyangiaceae bacterium]|nr:HAD family phosphatase [Polyangiaceae bacterium]